MDMLHRVMAWLDIKGISYVQSGDSVQMILCSQQHKWKCAVTADDDLMTIYSRYPWTVSEKKTDRVLIALNDINKQLKTGCFVISNGEILFRYSVFVSDPLLFVETVSEHFGIAVAMTEKAWDKLFSVLNSAEV